MTLVEFLFNRLKKGYVVSHKEFNDIFMEWSGIVKEQTGYGM